MLLLPRVVVIRRVVVALVLSVFVGVTAMAQTTPAWAFVAGCTFINKTVADGLGNNYVYGVYAVGSNVYAGTTGGLSISTDSGTTFTNKTTADGLGNNNVLGVYAVGSTLYAATHGGLSISTDGGATFTNKTTADGLGNNTVYGVYAVGSTLYAGTTGGLSISTDSGTTFTNKTTADGLGNNNVYGVYAVGSTVYAATLGGLSISTDGGTTFTNKTTADGLGNNTVLGVYVDGSNVYAATSGGLSISTNCGPSASASADPGVPGIFLAVNDVLVGSQVTGAPIYCGADSIQPNSIYTLSIQSVTNSALTRIILDSGSVNSRGHLAETVLLPEVNPGSYKIVMTGIHASGNLLVLTNFITIGANGGIVSVSPESQQPFLK